MNDNDWLRKRLRRRDGGCLLLLLPVLAGLGGGACRMDSGLTQWCASTVSAFDIEEVSILQDAQSYSMTHDAVALSFDAELPEGARWRVAQVDIMPILPREEFEAFEDGQDVTVEVWEGSNPTHSEPWSLQQDFDKDALTWTDAWLPDAQSTDVGRQQYAWWTFDLRDRVPVEGIEGREYMVGVAWGLQGQPPLGYSNFELSCQKNWTDWGSGFSRNADGPEDDSCSWPMLRVQVEVLEERATCTEGSKPVE